MSRFVEPPVGAGFPKDKTKVKGESQEKGEPPGGGDFEAEVAHPKDKAKVKGEPPGGTGFEAEQVQVIEEEKEREVAGLRCGDAGLWGDDARGRGPKEAG